MNVGIDKQKCFQKSTKRKTVFQRLVPAHHRSYTPSQLSFGSRTRDLSLVMHYVNTIIKGPHVARQQDHAMMVCKLARLRSVILLVDPATRLGLLGMDREVWGSNPSVCAATGWYSECPNGFLLQWGRSEADIR